MFSFIQDALAKVSFMNIFDKVSQTNEKFFLTIFRDHGPDMKPASYLTSYILEDFGKILT